MTEQAFSWLTSDQIYTRKRKSGVSSLEILALPDDLRQLVNQVMRREPVTLDELVAALHRPESDVHGQAALLTAQGWLETLEIDGETHYRVHLARRHARSLPPGIWQVLEGKWKIQFFRHLNEQEQAELTQAFKLEQFEAGERLFQAGDWGHTMYLIEAGIVELVASDADGQPVVLANCKPGDIIGEVAVLLGERRCATARAAEPVIAWSLHKDDLDRLLHTFPAAGLSVRREIERELRGLKRLRAEKTLNPLLVIGQAAPELAQAITRYTRERILILDVHSPARPGAPNERIQYRPAAGLEGKELAAALRQGVQEFDRVLVAAPVELHPPVMSVIGQVALVVDLSAAAAPWVIAAARKRWTASPDRLDDLARRLTGRVIGLALSGGAARALAHIGVLQALEEAHIPIDMIASTGIGAVVAGLYAAGFSPTELADLWQQRERDLNPFEESFSLRPASRSAPYAAKRARNTLHKLLSDRTLADLRLPLYIVAADLSSNQAVILSQTHRTAQLQTHETSPMSQADLAPALEASLAMAGLVAPVEYAGRWLVDGDLINPLPGDVLIQHGADIVIGVSVIPSPVLSRTESGRLDLTATWLHLRDQLAHTALQPCLRHLDALIAPPVAHLDAAAFDHATEFIALGRRAAQEELPHLQTLLAPGA